MVIRKLNIRNFGKITDKTVELSEGVNILFGPNESGKTTLYHFLKGMLFGISRKRGKAAKQDAYSSYEPWENPGSFGGTIWFEGNGKTYRLVRSFTREYPRFELTNLSDGGRCTMQDLEELLGGVSEAIYENTVSVGQLKSVTGPDLTRELTNYMAACQGTLDNRMNLERANQLLKMHRKGFADQKDRNARQLQKEIEKLKAKEEVLVKDTESLRERFEVLRSQREGLGARSHVIEDPAQDDRILSLALERARSRSYAVCSFLGAVAAGAAFALQFPFTLRLRKAALAGELPDKTIWMQACRLFWLVICLSLLLFSIHLALKSRTLKQRKERLLAALDRQSHQKRKKNELRDRLEGSMEETLTQIKEKRADLDNLREEIRQLEAQQDLPVIQDKEIEAVNLALDRLQEASQAIRTQMGRQLRDRTSEILSEITEGKYGQIFLDEDLRMTVNTAERAVEVERFSRGTIEQIYFSLRMASGELLGKKELPVILDDIFGMYDDERLSAALTWLSRQNRQVLICTCHTREAELMRKLGLEFYEVELS